MKELTIEEKAARYDKAIDVARKINSGEGVAAPSGWTTCEVIFPELRESEDERIRKELLEHCKNQAKPYKHYDEVIKQERYRTGGSQLAIDILDGSKDMKELCIQYVLDKVAKE